VDAYISEHFLNNETLGLIRIKANQIAGKYGFHRDEIEDVQQALIVQCLERIGQFDARRSGLRTFVRLVINSGIATMIEAKTARCRDYRLSLPFVELSSEPTSQTRQERGAQDQKMQSSGALERRLILRCDVNRIIASLSVELQQICRLLIAVERVAEVAEAAGISRATLHRRMRTIRDAFVQARLCGPVAEAGTTRAGATHHGRHHRGPVDGV
jgi:RNA polymerase sigma factor (sigma-70 family)